MNHVDADPKLGFVSWQQYGALHSLIIGCQQTGRTYRSASRAVSNAEHRKLLSALSKRRMSFEDDLLKFVEGRSGLPSMGSPLNAIRRTLQWFFALTEGTNDGDTFRACANAEARVLRRYTRVLRLDWPLAVRDILRGQFREMETGYDHMRILRGLH